MTLVNFNTYSNLTLLFLNSVDQRCSEAGIRLRQVVVAQSWWFDATFLCASIWYGQCNRPGTLLLPSLLVFFTSAFNFACVVLDYTYL